MANRPMAIRLDTSALSSSLPTSSLTPRSPHSPDFASPASSNGQPPAYTNISFESDGEDEDRSLGLGIKVDDEKRAALMDEKFGARRTDDRIAMPVKAKAEEKASMGMVVFSVAFYLVAAIVMVMANKAVLIAVPAPLTFLFTQLVIAVILLYICSLFGVLTIPRSTFPILRGLWPLIAINVLGLSFNTFCLQYVDASFYQVARGLVLPLTVFFSRFLLATPAPTPMITLSIVLVCIGFCVGVSSASLSVPAFGIAMGVFSSVTTALHAIVIKRSLNVIEGGTMDLTWYTNLYSAAVVGPMAILAGEMPIMRELLAGGSMEGLKDGMGSVADAKDVTGALRTFVVGAAITGFFGFLICIAGFLSIKVTSPTSHMISNAVRGVVQTWLGVVLFGDVISRSRGTGILFILSGSILYTYLKSLPETPSRSKWGRGAIRLRESPIQAVKSPQTGSWRSPVQGEKESFLTPNLGGGPYSSAGNAFAAVKLPFAPGGSTKPE